MFLFLKAIALAQIGYPEKALKNIHDIIDLNFDTDDAKKIHGKVFPFTVIYKK